MKVLFVSSGNRNKGGSNIIKNQGKTLIKHDIDLNFYTVEGVGFIGYLRNLRSLRRILRDNSFDIIHAHYGLSGILSLFSKKKEAIIVSFMGDDILGSEKSSGGKTWISLIIAKINKWLSIRYYDAVIVKSPEMAKKFSKSGDIHLIPNGVDIDKFKPLQKVECRNKLNWSSDEFHILFPSDPARIEKNFGLVKNALALIDSGKKIKIHILKDISHEEIPVYINASDAVVMASMHEGSPNVIKEAMACNCPVVSTRVGDVETVLGNTIGCFISSFNSEEFASKIKSAILFSEREGRTNGRDRIIELGLESDNIAQKIITVYKSVLSIYKKVG